MARVKLLNVSKVFDSGKDSEQNSGAVSKPFAIRNLNLTIRDGQLMVLMGPSGCGKSTLLRLIAGLMEPDSGQIFYDGVDMGNIPPNQRHIGMVFQDYALYPQHTVKMNIMSYFRFHKKIPNLDKEAEEKYRRTSRLMGVELDYLLDKMPNHLSGGEQQKVAIARCITRDPELFLMDEPFANLDQKLRETYRVQLKRLLQEFRVTTVYVTHDQREALALADSIAIMNAGQLEQVGPPRYLYDHPKNLFVAEFLNFDQETPSINLISGESVAPEFAGKLVGVRPEDITVCQSGVVAATITDLRRHPLSRELLTTLAVGGYEWGVSLPADSDAEPGQVLPLCFDRYHLFNPDTGQCLA
jgi:ABC-type sugar transport system ATPase subunit